MLGFVGALGDSNYGDYAMFVNNVKSLNIKECVVFSYNNDLLMELKKNYLQNCVLHTCSITIDYQYEEIFTEKYHVEYDTRVYVPLEILNMIRNIEEVKDNLLNVETLIVCGGGYFNHIWNAKHRKNKLLSIIGTILLANQLNKKILFMGNTFGPFNESSAFFSAFFNVLRNVVYATRDKVYSTSELRKLGIFNAIEIIPDDLYFLDDTLTDNRDAIITGNKYVVVEFYSSMEDIKNHIKVANDFVEKMRDLGYKTVFLPLDKGFGGAKQGQLLKDSISEIEIFSWGGGY